MGESKKALIVATIASFIASFEIDDILRLKSLGYEVHCATNFNVCNLTPKMERLYSLDIVKHQISFERNPLDINNISAYRQLKKVLNERFDIVHCHTPVGGVLARLLSRKYRNNEKGTKVIYSAHGFHFFKGAPVKNWILFYPIEWLLSWFTDILITINTEDYTFAKNHLHAKKVCYLPGVGIDTDKFNSNNINIADTRNKLGLADDEIMLLSVGELSVRKNHILAIKAVSMLKNDKIKYFIVGEGSLKEMLQDFINELHMEKQIFLLGYRTDIVEMCSSSDMFIFPSLQEGLPVALMEAIACKTPVICSRIRGNVDLLDDDSFAFSPRNWKDLMSVLKEKIGNGRNYIKENCKVSVINNSKRLEAFKKEAVNHIMIQLYSESL